MLEECVDSRSEALALEALHAARRMVASPYVVRGGPWASPRKLTSDQLAEVRAVAPMRAFMPLWELASADTSGRLYRHLQHLVFVPAADAPVGASTVRGAYVCPRPRKKVSGVPGNATRKRLVDDGLVFGGRRHRQLHRGRDPTERRQVDARNRRSKR